MIKQVSVLVMVIFIVVGCASTPGNTKAEKRDSILKMKREVLAELNKLKPDANNEISKAPGYAVFSNVNVHILIAGVGGGYGVVKNNKTGKHTYMKMGEAGLGLGLGVKDFRVVFVFHDEKTMNHFIESGWEFGGQADAAAKSGSKGEAVSGEASFRNITIYPITKSGLALQATVKGTKYWKDPDIN